MYTKGIYAVEFISQGFNEAQTGTTQFFVQFKVIHKIGSDGAVGVPEQGGEETFFRAITDKTVEFFIDDLKKLNVAVAGLDIQRLDPTNPDPVLVGELASNGKRYGRMYAGEETYNGKTKVKWGTAGGMFTPKAASSLAVGKLNALFGRAVRNLGGPIAPPPPPPPPATTLTNQSVIEDDVPF